MTPVCAKCHHARQADATASAWSCPACGAACAKASPNATVGDRRHASRRGRTRPASAGAAPPLFTTLAGRAMQSGPRGGRAQAQQALAAAAKIEIYTASFCETCKIDKVYMNQPGMAYTEYDVEADIDGRRQFYARGGKGTPLLLVYGHALEGFDVRAFERPRSARS